MADALSSHMLDTIYRHGMLAAGDRVLVAVSGGPDSMALLHLLHEVRENMGVELVVAHFDHGLRPQSQDDVQFVKEAAETLGLAFETERAELSGEPGNVQSIARDARYGFLERVAKDLGRNRVATGHNMDDQAETYLMRDIRGSGTSGLKGIPPVRGMYIRPLIETRREDITAYLGDRGIKYLTDPTNLKTVYLRNRVRLELLPIIEDINPNAVETLSRSADIARVEDNFLNGISAAALDDATLGKSETSLSLDTAKLVSMHPAIRRRVIRSAIEHVKGNTLAVTYSHTLDAERLMLKGGTGKGIDLPGGVRLDIVYDTAVFSVPAEPTPYRYELKVPGRTELPEPGVTITVECSGLRTGRPNEAVIDRDRLYGPLVARSRMPGDRFRPAGLGGTVKLKDFFINEKLPRRERDTIPVIVAGNDIVWVAGLRVDERFAAGTETKNPLRLVLES